MHKKKIYVDIAALLDVRIGTFLNMRSNSGMEITRRPEYYFRNTDNPKDFLVDKKLAEGLEKYKDYHSLNLEKCIRSSPVTMLPTFISELGYIMLQEENIKPQTSDRNIELVINSFPYTFTKEENIVLQNTISNLFKNWFSVIIIRENVSILKPMKIKSEFSSVIMYDPSLWLELHKDEIMTGCLFSVPFYFPAIDRVRSLTDDEHKKISENNFDNEFRMLEFAFSPVMGVSFKPIALMSINTPMNPLSPDLMNS